MRFVHASPDAGAVDIAVDGNTLLNDVTFGTASGHIEAESGERTIEVRKDGTTVLKLDDFSLTAGTKITAYVIGNASKDSEDGEGSGLRAVTSLEATNPAGNVDDDDEDEDEDNEDDD